MAHGTAGGINEGDICHVRKSDIIPAIVTTRTMSGASGGTTMESEAWSTRKELVMGGRMNDAADAVSAVKVSKLVKRYGRHAGARLFRSRRASGEIFGLLGLTARQDPAINCILALLTFDEGTVRVFGEPISPYQLCVEAAYRHCAAERGRVQRIDR